MTVQITLNFASPAEAAAALNRLVGPKTEAEAALAQPLPTKDKAKPTTEAAKDPKPEAEKTAKDTKPPAAAKTETPAATPATAATAQTGAPDKGEVLDYTVLQQAVFKLAGKDKAQIPPLLAKFGVPHFKEVPAEKRAEALAAVNEVLAQLEVA